MAEQEEGNIKQNYNNATVGLNLDQSLNQIKKGTLTYALNAAVENFDANSVNYQNEPGNEFCVSFPEGYVLIGNYFINELNKHIFWLTNPNDGGNQIGYMDNNDCVYKVLVNAPCLNFDINFPIHKAVHRITNCTTEIYWADGKNSRRYLDINDIPKILNSGSPLCSPVYSDDVDCNQLNIQPDFDIPQLKVKEIVSGGDLTAGTVQFAVQYSDASANPYTSYYSITNPTPIADNKLTTVNFNYSVGKSVNVEISNLDLSGQFQYFNLAVIKTVNNISSVELIGTYFIDKEIKNVTYTGQNKENIRLTINDIFEKYPYYDVASDVTAVQDILVWSNLTTAERINYQQIVNKITLGWETHRIPADENYSDELNATNLRGFLRDEVYALEAVFLLTKGRQTDKFHVPGRAKNSNENLQPDVLNTNPDFIGNGITAPYWKIYNTASVTGYSPEYSGALNYKGPYQYGEFAYWESLEEYPCTENMWGELAGQKIRHHKFPDVLVSPIQESRLFTSESSMVMGNDAVFPIGIKIDIQQIKSLIGSSNLTAEQKKEIVGIKIVRGDRGTNKSIIGKGILRNVNKYERENQTFYFPNYPYNDLNQDPFLNETNNAFSQICEPFIVNVLKFNLPVENPTYLEVQYNDCNTNKTAFQKFTTLGEHKLCSIGVPTIQGSGVKNEMTQTSGGPVPNSGIVGYVSYANYDVWAVTRDGNQGLRVGWDDVIEGSNSEQWIDGVFGGSQSNFRLFTKVNTVPVQIEGPGDLVKTLISEVRDTSCSTENPLTPIKNDPELAYRQVFNSPETSFGQPFLGDILKLESVIFGKGSAHFVEVKKNAKYKLLTEEAQRDALLSSEKLGNYTTVFDATAMFTAYQAYLTIYINGITRKNYAYLFNSIADYNYSVGVPNDLGVKQRNLDISRYLIPGVQSVGENNININNYNRESSVYLRTDLDKPSLPFPNQSPNMLLGSTSIVTDKSRFIISEKGNCNNPAKEEDITVVSYYASLKVLNENQWGQIYSYNSVDTGYQVMFDAPVINETIFGGDTFISRFTFKTKLPFFIDNRVNAPDDSDIFYDEIGNVGYPKFWHSARSILKSYVAEEIGTMSNIISYKAHNFDCPNSQGLATPTSDPDTNPNRTFYDGYFYLFAYGVPNFYCESSYNTDLRQAFNNKEGDFWPHVNSSIPDDWVQESNVSIVNDNTYNYNVTYSKQNKENTFTFLPPDWEDKLCFTNYPFRAVYSDLQSTDSDNRVNNWLIYRAISYFDFPQNYGKLISLDGIQNRAILARFENKTLLYNNLLTLDTSNPQAAYLGNPRLFEGAPPIDFAETDLGYVGTQHKLLLKIPQGQITVDAKRGQVFLISGTEAVDLTAFGSGMNRFFTDHLAFKILKYFPNVNIDNNFTGVGLHGVFDSKYDRIIITKLDYIPLNNNIIYDESLKQFFLLEKINDITIRNRVYLTDTTYFCNKSWTLSFNFNTKSWVSFHSYLPNWYIGENNFFYSGKNDCCEDIEFVVSENIPTPITTTTTTTIAITNNLCVNFTVNTTTTILP
jgi:hypothetical protein